MSDSLEKQGLAAYLQHLKKEIEAKGNSGKGPLEWGRDVQARAHGGHGAQLQMELTALLSLLKNRGLTKERAQASIATVFYKGGDQ